MADTQSTPNDGRTTASDAIAQLSLARLGSLVTADGKPLTLANLPYLLELRNRVFEFSDAIESEIARIARASARGSALPCCCDPGESYTCEQHRGTEVTR